MPTVTGTPANGFDTDSTPNTFNFNMTEINDVPELDLNGADLGTSNAINFAENQFATLLAPNSTLIDPDALDYENGTLTVEFTAGASFDDQLRILDTGGIIVDENSISWLGTTIGFCSGGTDFSQPLVITFNEFALPAAVEALVRAVAFGNFSDAPAEGERTLTFTLTDGVGGTSAPVTATVDVTAVDDTADAFDDTVNTGENLILDGNVLGNDFDADGPAPSVLAVNGMAGAVGSTITLASGALLTMNADGSFSYDPNGQFAHLISFEKAAFTHAVYTGPTTDSFTYTITGGDSATVTIFIVEEDGDGDVLRGTGSDDLLVGTDASEIFVLTDGGNDSVTGAGGDDFFDFGVTLTPADSVDGGDGYDTVLLESLTFLVLAPTTLTHVENIVLTGSTSNLLTDDATVGAGAVLRIDGSAIGAADQFNFNGMAESDGRFILIGGAGQDNITAGDGDDLLIGGGGFNSLRGGNGSDTVDYSAAPNAVYVNLASEAAFDNGYVNQDMLVGIENLIGSAYNDQLTGDAGNNRLDGGLGADLMFGGDGDDAYVVDYIYDGALEANSSGGVDTVYSSASFSLGQFVENLTLTGTDQIQGTGNELANILTGNSNGNMLDGGLGDDFMRGGLGDDVYFVRDAGDVVSELAGQGADWVFSTISYTLGAGVEHLFLAGVDSIDGTGNQFANNLQGNSGNNILDGKAGADSMWADTGNDIYIVDNIGDSVAEASAAGTDEVRSSVTFTLGSNLENLVLTGAGAVNGTGNSLVNSLTGNSSHNILDGGAGADTMTGGLGNDTYVFDNAGDVAIEAAGEGTDTIQTAVAWTLAANFENLTLTGTNNVSGTGNGANNFLVGNSGANTLDGLVGTDTMAGGGGNDTFIVDNVLDQVIELAGGGSADTVRSSASYTLAAEVENLILTGTAAINGAGNALANTLTGNDGNNTLTGGLGADTLKGGLGDDTYVVDNAGDIVSDVAGQGTDKVLSSVSFTLGGATENLTLTESGAINATGNVFANVLIGNNAANILDGGAGADVMNGGLGSDTYIVDNSADQVIETSAGDTDVVQSSASFVLGSNIEQLILTGAFAVNGTGNQHANSLTGNNAANILDGGFGADTMSGGLGNDTYVIDNAGDVVTELAGGGIDTIRTSSGHVLAAELENLTLTGTGNVNGTGNDVVNILVGNDGANRLDGGIGADTMQGGLGNDSYVVDNGLDKVIESAGGGTDTVNSSITHQIATEVENLVLTGTSAINGYGNALANSLTGNDAANRLDGGGDADFMKGGLGDDLYIVDNFGDVVSELAGQGTDRVESAISYTLGITVENLTLTGSAAFATGNLFANVLIGNNAANVLNGGGGADTMNAGLGDDLYMVDNVGDSAFETSTTGGTDEVQSSVTYALSTNIEKLTLTGTAAINGTGNTLNNVLTGNAGANILNGGAGADTMQGGLGDDTYVIVDAGDVAIENAGEGNDTIQTSLNHVLGAEFEKLILTGTGNLNGTGNGLANTLTGNTGTNQLDGGAGGDIMIGGLGNDYYFVDDGLDQVIEAAGGGTETVESSVTHSLEAEVENMILTGAAAINGFGNGLANNLTGNDADNTLDGGLGADTLEGGLGDDTYIVDQAGDVVTELTDEGTDTVQSTVSYALSATVENLILGGTGDINGTGNALNNILTGNDGANILDGGAGFDRLYGGLGDDTYLVEGTDQVTETDVAGGVDHVISSVNFTLGANLENLTITGTVAQYATGNALANTVTGNALGNWLSGRDGNDIIVGGGGGDQLYGEAGDDQLFGGLGDDVLRPSEGNDTLTGGEGTDGFVFSAALNGLTNVDVITDFVAGEEHIFLNHSDFAAITASYSQGNFQLGATALEADDRILYDATTGHIFYDADGVGGVDAVHFASVTAGMALTYADFIAF